MFKLFKDSFKATNEGIILAIPLVLFMWLLQLYILYSKEVVDTIPEFILSAVTILFMMSAFCSGWFYMIKKCIEFYKKDFILDKDKASESLKLIQALPVGVGKHFLTFVGVAFVFALLLALLLFVMYKVSIPFIKDINFSFSQMGTVLNSPQEMANFLNNLSPEQLIALFNLNIILMVITSLFSFLIMLWIPEIIYRSINPVLALFTSIKKIFVKFWKSIVLFLYVSLVNFFISFFSTFAFTHPIVYMVMMILYFYFIVYVIVLIFLYYDREFASEGINESAETEDNSDSGADGQR